MMSFEYISTNDFNNQYIERIGSCIVSFTP